MTDQTTADLAATSYLLLEDAARQARDRRDTEVARLRAEAAADYQRTSVDLADRAVRKVFGVYAAHASWRPAADADTALWYQATAELDGLRFLVTAERGGHGARVYLLAACPNPDHDEADRRIEVRDLAHLADVLDDVDALKQSPGAHQRFYRDCEACEILREDRVEVVVQQADSAREQLAAAVDRYLDERIGRRLDDFLATYLPDRI